MPFILEAIADDSCNVTATPLNEEPVADFTLLHDGYAITFTDMSEDISGEIVAWNWTFDDGNYSEEQNPIHLFGAYGYYNVTLNVTDDGGLYDNITRRIEVYESTELAFIDYIEHIFLFTLLITFAAIGEYTHHQYIYHKRASKRGTILFLFAGMASLALCFTDEIQGMTWLFMALLVITIVYWLRWGLFTRGTSP